MIVPAEGPIVPRINDQRCQRWLFIYLIKGRQTHGPVPLHDSGTTFSPSNFDLNMCLLLQAPKFTQEPPKPPQNPPQKPPPEPLFSVCNFHTQFSKQNCPISYSARAAQVHSVPLFTRWNWVRHIHTAQKILPRIASNFRPNSRRNCVQNVMKNQSFPNLLLEPHFSVFFLFNMPFLSSKTDLKNLRNFVKIVRILA